MTSPTTPLTSPLDIAAVRAGQHQDLSDAKLAGQDLSGANLVGVNLARADLSGANLTGANLRDRKSVV